MTSRVCVHIPSYNQRAFLAETIDSVLAQTFRDFHIIIVDDASTDGSKEIIADYVRRYPGRIEAIVNETNLGIPRRLGVALSHCRSEFFCYLDGDDLWERDALEALVAALERQPDAGLAYGDVRWFDEKSRDTIALTSEVSPPATGHVFEELLSRQNFMMPQALLFRRKMFDASNVSLDAPPFEVGGDIYLLFSVCFMSPVAYVPRVLGHYRIHGGNKSLETSWGTERLRALGHMIARCPETSVKVLECLERAWAKRPPPKIQERISALAAERDRYKASLDGVMNKPIVRCYRKLKRLFRLARTETRI